MVRLRYGRRDQGCQTARIGCHPPLGSVPGAFVITIADVGRILDNDGSADFADIRCTGFNDCFIGLGGAVFCSSHAGYGLISSSLQVSRQVSGPDPQ